MTPDPPHPRLLAAVATFVNFAAGGLTFIVPTSSTGLP
jgi:hypothetical protein